MFAGGLIVNRKVIIIAEAGVNHNGNIKLAHKMIDEAKRAGADIVKFQTAKPEMVISKYADKAKYQKETTNSEESQLEMCKKIHLKFDDYIELKKHCEEVNIGFLSTPFDIESIDYLEQLGCDMWKIPSGEITNYPYLVKIAKTGKKVILSTGMCFLEEVEKAIAVLKEHGVGDIVLLHCTTQYPTPYKDVNLKAMHTLQKHFKVDVGYSDHTTGIEIPIAAVAMGATVIEKHFTLDREMEGPDHKASLEPEELKKMIESIRNVEVAMGNGEKRPAFSEIENICIARKSIIANKRIKKGEYFTTENITTKRPGNGISPMYWNEILGQVAIRDFEEDELIEI